MALLFNNVNTMNTDALLRALPEHQQSQFVLNNLYSLSGLMINQHKFTIMSLLEAPYLIEAPPSESAHCHRRVAPPQNRSAGRL